MNTSLSILIPCFNEELRIVKTISRLEEYFSSRAEPVEIIFLNDGSTDRTSEILQSLKDNSRSKITYKLVEWSPNRGKGFAVRTGLAIAVNDFVLICDADLSTPIEELEKFSSYLSDFDITVGSRRIAGARICEAQPALRVFLGSIFSALSGHLLGVGVRDFTCGFKLLRKAAAKQISARMRIDGWGYDSELLKIASTQNLRIKEVGVSWSHDPGSKVRLTRDIVRSAYELAQIVCNGLRGKYK